LALEVLPTCFETIGHTSTPTKRSIYFLPRDEL